MESSKNNISKRTFDLNAATKPKNYLGLFTKRYVRTFIRKKHL